ELEVLVTNRDTLRRQWEDGDLGFASVVMAIIGLMIPILMTQYWFESIDYGKLFSGTGFAFDHKAQMDVLNTVPAEFENYKSLREISYSLLGKFAGALFIGTIGLLIGQMFLAMKADKRFVTREWFRGAGSALMLVGFAAVIVCVFVGIAGLLIKLPAMAIEVPNKINPDGLRTPQWLTDIRWAKPSIMIMGFWAAIGSNNMLLYLAALSNVPQDLYEAADIDGASRFQRFWNITWPQLAPTTFFIVILGVIGGLQGGFETARIMTNGEPAGQTVSLAYFVYNQGFVTGALGYSSAIAWALFLMVVVVTLFNLRFGSRFVNE
ncbi:MAG TPA: sugar ABC transporter permease, partial [Tepidisphaeraceae bacterium]|nr:sugar ABC transporter permease [Tepidisphaeraceae bacterium]